MFDEKYEIDVEFEQTDTEVDAEFGKFQYIGVPGPQGEKGLDALVCHMFMPLVEYKIGDRTNLNLSEFNRTPVVGDYFATMSSEQHLLFEVVNVEGNTVSIKCKQSRKAKGDPGYTPVKNVDYFDGKDGYTPQKNVDYFDGKDGYTPIRGKDYYTEADKAEIVSSVLSSLPIYNGEVVDV